MTLQLHQLAGWLLVIATLGLVAFWLPPEDKILGSSYLIFFFHFPSAIHALNFFVIAGVLSGIYLFGRRSPSMDLWAASAVEVGMLACTITLVTGGIWARAAWGDWNTWMVNDPRLLTVYIMWFTYAAYLALRGSVEDPRKKELYCSVFGLVATVNVPIVYFAIQFFGPQHHPQKLTLEHPSLYVTRWFGVGAFLVLYLAFLRLRRRVHQHRQDLDRLEEAFGRAGI